MALSLVQAFDSIGVSVTASITVSGVTANNLLVLSGNTNGTFGFDSIPAGWTKLLENEILSSADPNNVTRADALVIYKIADGSEGTIELTQASSQRYALSVVEYSGVSTTSPLDDVNYEVSKLNWSGGSGSSGNITATASGLLLGFVFDGNEIPNIDTITSGFVEDVQSFEGGAETWNRPQHKVYSDKSGFSGSKTLSFDISGASLGGEGLVGIANFLEPSAGGSTAPTLSAVSAVNITANSITPQVTINF